jgi:hypothetical protein
LRVEELASLEDGWLDGQGRAPAKERYPGISCNPAPLAGTIENPSPKCSNGAMSTILRKYSSLDEMKADEYRYWQSRPAHERMDAVEDMIETAYALKGWVIEPDVPRLQRPFVRLSCPWR